MESSNNEERYFKEFALSLAAHLRTALDYLSNPVPQAQTNEFFRSARPLLREFEKYEKYGESMNKDRDLLFFCYREISHLVDVLPDELKGLQELTKGIEAATGWGKSDL